MLSFEDKEFIYNKIISNHPVYIIDEHFNKKINIKNIQNFIETINKKS